MTKPAHQYMLAAIGTLLLLGLFSAAGPKIGLAAVLGLILALTIWFWPMVGVILMIVTGVGIPSLVAANSYIPISITQVLAMLTIASGAYWIWMNRVELTYSPHFLAIGAFLVVVIVSTMVQPDLEQSKIGMSTYIRAGMFVLITACLITTRKAVLIGALSLTLAVTLCSVLGVAEYAVPGFHIPSDDDVQYQLTGAPVSTFSFEEDTSILRVSGGTGNYNWLAYTIAAGMPLNLFWWHYARGNLVKTGIVLATIVQIGALVLTYTRSGFIGLGAAVLFLTWTRKLPLWIPVTVTLLAVTTSPFWLPQRFLDRMLSVQYMKKGTTTIRRDFIYTGIEMFLKEPIFGHGYGQFGRYFIANSKGEHTPQMREEIDKGASETDIRPHNIYVDLACDFGAIGLLAYGAFIVMLYRDLSSVTKRPDPVYGDLAVILQSAIITFSVCGIFGHIQLMKILWVISGLTAALRRVTWTDRLTTIKPTPLKTGLIHTGI